MTHSSLSRTFALAALAAVLAAPTSALAETLTCQARVALNGLYDVTLDTTTGDVAVSNNVGTTINGRATVSVSGRTGNTILFLASSFDRGVELEVEAGDSSRIAMCLAANECYLCR